MKVILFFILFLLSLPVQAQWSASDLDTSPANRGATNAIAIDSSGRIHVSYTSSGFLSRRIRYIFRDTAGVWSDSIRVTPLDQSAVNLHSIAVSPNNEVFISYYDSFGDDLHLLRRPLQLGPLGAGWTNTLIDETGDVGQNPSSLFVGNQESLFTSYYSATDNQFKFAALNQTTGVFSLENIENDPLEAALGIASIGRNSAITSLRIGGVEGLGVIFKYRGPGIDDPEALTDYLGLALKVQSVEAGAPVPPGGFPPWLITPIILPTGDREAILLINGDLGDRFDIAVSNQRPGYQLCFYDRATEIVKYAQYLSLPGVEVTSYIEDVVSSGPGGDREILDDCSISVCGNQVHVIVRRDITVAGGPDAHAYESHTHRFPSRGDEEDTWSYLEIGRGIGSLHDPNWTVSSACDRTGGLHVVFPVRSAVSGVDLKHAYLAPPPPSCGDLICSGGEVLATCPEDCGVCGDGVCTGAALEDSLCALDCPIPACGNGVLEDGEECDDDNGVDGDGCNRDCRSEPGGLACGNRLVDDGEACDDGDRDSGDGCDANCQLEIVVLPGGPPPVIDDGVVDVGPTPPEGAEIETAPEAGGGCSLILPRR